MPEYVPVRIIERTLGMPKTTLQKVLKGGRELPKKWAKPLEAYFGRRVEKKGESDKKEAEHDKKVSEELAANPEVTKILEDLNNIHPPQKKNFTQLLNEAKAGIMRMDELTKANLTSNQVDLLIRKQKENRIESL